MGTEADSLLLICYTKLSFTSDPGVSAPQKLSQGLIYQLLNKIKSQTFTVLHSVQLRIKISAGVVTRNLPQVTSRCINCPHRCFHVPLFFPQPNSLQVKLQSLPEFQQVPKCPKMGGTKTPTHLLTSEHSLRALWTSLFPSGQFSDSRRELNPALASASGMTW